METRFGGVFRVILPNGIEPPKVNPVKELITYSEAGFSVPVVFETIKLSAEFAIQSKDEAQDLREKVNALFAVPNLSDDDKQNYPKIEEMWQLLKPMKEEFFAQIWKRVEGEDFDYSGCELVEENGDQKMKKQNEKHGFMREGSGYVSFKNGAGHGLTVEIWSDEIRIYIYKNDQELFYLEFDKTGKITFRDDETAVYQFADIIPETFLKNWMH